MVDDPDREVRVWVARALGLVLTFVDDPSWEVRKGVASALAAAPDEKSLTPLAELTTDDNIDVRKVAVQSLAHRRDALVARGALKRSADDSDADVRAYARAAMAHGS